MLRAELWVHRKSTFNGLASVTLDSLGLAGFTNILSADLTGLPLATVLGQIRKHGIHAVVLSAIDQVAPTSLLRNQVGVHQLFQMERKCVCWHTHLLCYQGWRQAFTPLHNQRAKNLQPVGLSQSGKCFYYVFVFHTSILMEI